MNNWDKRPELVVVYGGDVPHHILEDVAINALQLSKDVEFPMIMDDAIIYDIEDMVVPHINSVIVCLQDHIDNTKPEEWLEHQSDYCIPNQDLDPVEDELWVSISKGTYYAQNCKVTVYNITI